MEGLAEPFGGFLGPVGQTLLIPALAALVVAAGVRALGGRSRASLAAGLGLGAGLAAIAWALGGAPRLIQPAGVDKLVLATLAFPLIAFAMLRRGRLEPRAILPIAALAPVLWIGWPFLMTVSLDGLMRLAAALAAGGVLAYGLGRADGRALPGLTAILALGLAGLAVFGASLKMGQLMGGLAVGALAGPLGVFAAGALAGGGAGAVGAGLGAALVGAPFRAAAVTGTAAGAAILLLFTAGAPLAAALLAPAALADDLAERLTGAAGGTRRAVVAHAIAAGSAAAAVAYAFAVGGAPYTG